MQDTEKKILDTFKRVIPTLTSEQQMYLLGVGEGLAFRVEASKSAALCSRT